MYAGWPSSRLPEPKGRVWGCVKRRDLIRRPEEMGCLFIRHGSNRDWYQNPRTKVSQPVPRHREINERLAQHILKTLSDEA